MKILMPIDWKTVDLETEQDANIFGEALREYCFVGNCMDTGCYTTFNLLENFKEIKEGKYFDECVKHLYENVTPHVYLNELKEKDCWVETDDPEGNLQNYKLGEPFLFVVGWTWEGDGCLYLRYNNKAVVNTDCKNNYEWRWTNE